MCILLTSVCKFECVSKFFIFIIEIYLKNESSPTNLNVYTEMSKIHTKLHILDVEVFYPLHALSL